MFLRVQLHTARKRNDPALQTYNSWAHKKRQNLELHALTEVQQFATSIPKHLMVAISVETCSAPVI
jgi:hypothetical protein